MSFGKKVKFEQLRTVGFAGIGAAYAALGVATTDYTRIVSIYNATNQDVIISTDGVTDMIRIAAGTGQVFDFSTNKTRDEEFFMPKGTIFYQKHAGVAPNAGNLWVQVTYAAGGV